MRPYLETWRRAQLSEAFLQKQTPFGRIRMVLHATIGDRPSETQRALSFDQDDLETVKGDSEKVSTDEKFGKLRVQD
jgi:hypothetical protein